MKRAQKGGIFAELLLQFKLYARVVWCIYLNLMQNSAVIQNNDGCSGGLNGFCRDRHAEATPARAHL